MAVYSRNGDSLSSIFDADEMPLSAAFDVNGQIVFGNDPDYDEWETEYQHTILQARDAWKTEYRADNTIIPLIVHTDQHRYLNSAHKPTFDYLTLAVKWSEVSAVIGLGDVCGAAYNTTDLNNMVTCLSSLPKTKRLDIYGNHDCQLPPEQGSEYAYAPLPDSLYHTLQDTYFNNSGFGGNNSDTRFGFKGLEYVVDPLHNVKFCVFAVWVTRGDPWHHYYCDADTIDAMISMLSTVDNRDIVILSHIEPYARQMTLYKPAVDGASASQSTVTRGTSALGYSVQLDQLYADRKARRAGSITDCDGNVHTYDFRSCTSDLLCSLNGHWHEDNYAYSPDGTVPTIEFDAYRYDAVPFYFVNIDKTRGRLNVWKVDEASHIYNYQVPFEEPEEQT